VIAVSTCRHCDRLVLYLLAAEIASRRAALVAGLVMATMFRFVTFARIGLTDAPVMFFVVAAVYGFIRAVPGFSSVIYYSRRHVIALDGDDDTVVFLSAHPGAVCVMPMTDFERLAPRLRGFDEIVVAEEFNVRIERLLQRHRTPGRLWVLIAPT
jgi:predicted membrane-bound mannosyltransferase